MAAYAQSKLANLMFSLQLEQRLRAARLGAISVAAHPGVANTMLFVNGEYPAWERAVRKAVGVGIGMLLNDEQEGALPTLYAATADKVVGGGYYGPQGWLEMRGGDVGLAKIATQALDEEAQMRLWDRCVEMTGVELNVEGLMKDMQSSS